MNRRGFLKLLGVGLVAMTLSPLAVYAESSSITLCGTLQVGDVFTISGVYQRNPLGGLQEFVVTGVVADGDTVTCALQ